MTSGGSRNRSGPAADLNSLRSEKRGLALTALPGSGYAGQAPEFPLMPYTVHRWEFEEKRRYQVVDVEETAAFRERELELWAQAWTYPQAAAWAREPWRWQTVAMWVRTVVVCESSAATAADKGAIHRFADQIGMTPAGLKENGWAIAHDQTAEKREAKAQTARKPSARDRMKVVRGGDGA